MYTTSVVMIIEIMLLLMAKVNQIKRINRINRFIIGNNMSNKFKLLVENSFALNNPEESFKKTDSGHNHTIHQALDNPELHKHIDVAKEVKSPLTRNSVLERTIKHPDHQIRLATLRTNSPHLSKEHITSALSDHHPKVKAEAMYEYSKRVGPVPVEHLHNALASNDENLAKSALLHKNINYSHIEAGLKHHNPLVRLTAALHPNATTIQGKRYIENPDNTNKEHIKEVKSAHHIN